MSELRVGRSTGRLVEAGEGRQVGAVLSDHARVVARFRLVGFQRAEADHVCADTAQLQSVVFERSVRPGTPTFTQRRVHLTLLVAGEKRQLEPDRATRVPGVPVLAFLWRVFPPIRRQQCGNSVWSFSNTAMSTSSCGRVTVPA